MSPRGTADDPLNLSAPEQKDKLRKELLFTRQQFSIDEQRTYNWQVANNVRNVVAQETPGVIAFYQPLEGEVDLNWLAEDLAQTGYTLTLPRVAAPGLPLIFNHWTPGDQLDHDKRGIPCASGSEILPALMLIPCVGFDRRGYRLGYGKGFYDMTLKSFEFPVVTCGIAQSGLEVEQLPDEYHDIPLDYVCTEKEVILCQR